MSSTSRRWTDDASDPNDPVALARRAEVLRRAWRPPISDRVEHLVERCRGRHVLDIGCVAHDTARMQSTEWLHGRLASSARKCLGVDVHEDGVGEMNRAGFTAVSHDLRQGLGPIADHAPFDVIVAGELIEHVESIDMLFSVASSTLTDDGELVITTPNPWAPERVRAGQLGYVWENVDHILFAFPSGVAELAERHGLLLAEAMTTCSQPFQLRIRDVPKAAYRRLRGGQWVNVGYDSTGPRRERRIGFGRLSRLLHGLRWPRRRFVGETFVYVIRRSADHP